MWFPFYCPVIIIIWSMKTEGKSEPVCKSQCDQSGVVCCVQCTVQPVITCVACTVCTVYSDNSMGVQRRVYTPQAAASLRTSSVQRSVLGSLLSQGVAVAELPYSVITDPSVVTMWHPEVTTVMCDTLTQLPRGCGQLMSSREAVFIHYKYINVWSSVLKLNSSLINIQTLQDIYSPSSYLIWLYQEMFCIWCDSQDDILLTRSVTLFPRPLTDFMTSWHGPGALHIVIMKYSLHQTFHNS